MTGDLIRRLEDAERSSYEPSAAPMRIQRDLPILFSAPMVRAILGGTKTQTRRVLKVPSWSTGFHDMELGEDGIYAVATRTGCLAKVPLRWAVGDRLWVRETWQTLHKWDDLKPRYLMEDVDKIRYEADAYKRNPLWAWGKLRPSIFMPRWASRITLEVTGIRVERLQDINGRDAIAEGLQRASGAWWSGAEGQSSPSAIGAYALLWNSINGPGAWDTNPWVVVIEFRRDVANAE